MKSIISVFFVLAALCGSSLGYAAAKPADKASRAEAQVPQQVNINKADAETLSIVLKGVGIKKAEAIVAYRKKHGKFKQYSDLLAVKGIGEKTLETNKKRIILR
ncbi:MAG: helix-hairpin-helix domain-containing protein [Cellvibrionaceae bacterium]